MNPSGNEKDRLKMFDSFCKKVLTNEVRNYHREMERLREKEVSFTELSTQELGQLAITDNYFSTEQIFNVLGLDVIVNSECIATALSNLPQQKRDIILLSYFLELSDAEIGKRLNLIRSTVQYQRASTLRELKRMIQEETADE